jgi:hypothetical protein
VYRGCIAKIGQNVNLASERSWFQSPLKFAKVVFFAVNFNKKIEIYFHFNLSNKLTPTACSSSHPNTVDHRCPSSLRQLNRPSEKEARTGNCHFPDNCQCFPLDFLHFFRKER